MIVRQGQIVAYGQDDAGTSTASGVPETAQAGVSLAQLFAVSVAAGVTVWAVTSGLKAILGMGGRP